MTLHYKFAWHGITPLTRMCVCVCVCVWDHPLGAVSHCIYALLHLTLCSKHFQMHLCRLVKSVQHFCNVKYRIVSIDLYSDSRRKTVIRLALNEGGRSFQVEGPTTANARR